MNYKRFILTALLLVGAVSSLFAQRIHDLDIRVRLNPDGSGDLTEVWDVNVEGGTEWYVPISNLKNMDITGFRVFENGVEFANEGRKWDVERSAARKNGRCGIVEKGDGLELCWGQGGNGPHVWKVQYRIEGLVQAYEDYDGFNFMFVNPGMGNGPEHVKVTLENASSDSLWTSENVKVWGFGHEGSIFVEDGRIIQETYGKMSSDAKVITLVRFDKGLFEPSVSNSLSFSFLQDRAMEGSNYIDDEGNLLIHTILFVFLGSLALLIYSVVASAMGYKYRKSIFGKRKITGWYREAPFEGFIPAAYYINRKGHRFVGDDSSYIIGVYFLKWILDGTVKVLPDASGSKKKLNLDFRNEVPAFSDEAEKMLYEMASEAAGANGILETKELEKWGMKHDKKFAKLPEKISNIGFGWLAGKGYMAGPEKCTERGQAEACHVIEFKNFLKDFTLSNERGAEEVVLWKNCLVYAQLFGIADKVAKQFKDLYPTQFGELAEECGLSDVILYQTILNNNRISITAYASALSKNMERTMGGGGSTSFGGGGGFSGGGFGGGSR